MVQPPFLYIYSYNYLFLKYSKIVFFIQKKNTRTIWNDLELERSGTFRNVRRTFRQESNERPYLYIKINNFIFNSTCSSFGVIYIIACKRCNKYYIGETKRTAFKRFSEHLKNILSFRINIDKSLINYENVMKQLFILIVRNMSFTRTGNF